jgi:hypothetical protein
MANASTPGSPPTWRHARETGGDLSTTAPVTQVIDYCLSSDSVPEPLFFAGTQPLVS